MRVDFYVLGRTAPDAVITALAAKALGEGERLLIAEGQEARRNAISDALWQFKPEQFLANGFADQPHAARQPILIAGDIEPANGARLLCLADGTWRDAEGFDRIFYLFGDDALPEARSQWRQLDSRDDVERRFWKQDEQGRWQEGP